MACTSSDPVPSASPTSSALDTALSIREVVDRAEVGDRVRVGATLVTEGGVPYLCDWVEESDPVQCGEPQLELSGAPLDDLGLRESRGELSGEVDIVIEPGEDGGAVFVDEASP